MKLFQNLHHLRRQRDNMRSIGLWSGIAPFTGVKINIAGISVRVFHGNTSNAQKSLIGKKNKLLVSPATMLDMPAKIPTMLVDVQRLYERT
jgi:hypothetical protein